jgi:hypothetical protein
VAVLEIAEAKVQRTSSYLSGNPTYQDLAAWSDDKFRVADDSEVVTLWLD